MAVRLRIRELAEARGLNISSLQREAKIPMSTARRIWYSTSDGSEKGPPLKLVNLEVIDQLARFFDIQPGELFEHI
ncbi:helix-turn-helix transcriptional regulator [Candidatus Gracilibacteria bacterium]|nr:helix-turn-helix transcriptional regulator [Candidatus Gracilibacteria bacterium]